MRAWLALPLLVLTALPVLGAAPALCDAVKDPAALPAPAAQLGQVRALGLDLTLAQPIPLLPAGEAEDQHPCSGRIRPGAQLVINGGWLCTANWVYKDELDRLYLGTAGHCAVPGDRVTIGGVGRVGDVVFSTGDGGVGNDFALIRVDPALYHLVTPTMCHWGGPVNVAQDQHFGYAPVGVLHYGFGFLYGNTPVTRPRAGSVHGFLVEAESFAFEGTIAPGDSGSAIQFSSGHALGVITHGLLAPGPVPVGLALGLGTRVTHGIAMANAATGLQFQVVMSGTPVDLTGLSVP